MESSGGLIILRPHGTALDQLLEGHRVPLGGFPCLSEGLKEGAERKVVVDCRHGLRSLRATAFLHKIGIEDPFSMAGGIEALFESIDLDVPNH